MHDTALEYGRLFFKTYIDSEKSIKVLDLGFQDVNGSLRSVAPKKAEYIGVDFADGMGDDIKITEPYKLPFEDNFFDVAVSSSCFEHSEFFWLSFLELLRVLKLDGLLYINAPSNGSFHRYPVDCWRFYPDSGIALQNWAHRNGLNDAALLESFIGIQKNDIWNDFVAVFIKSKKHAPYFEKRMINTLTEYSNGHLKGSEKILNLEDQPFDQLIIGKQKDTIQNLEQIIANMEKSNSWQLTRPLRWIRRKLK
jgi:SAM-dependent methyltransferase